MDPKVAAWFTFSAVVIGALVSVFRADNTALPFTLSTGLRASLALGLGAVQTCLMAVVSGTPWLEAFGTACASVIVAFMAHGAPHVPDVTSPSSSPKADQRGFASVRALLIVGALGWLACIVPLIGCAWWQHGGEVVVITEAEKIIAEALEGKSVEQIAIDLGIDVAEVIAQLLRSGQRVNHTKAFAEALKVRATMLAMPAADGGL